MTPEVTAEIHERLEKGMVQAREKLEKSRGKLERLKRELPHGLLLPRLNPEI